MPNGSKSPLEGPAKPTPARPQILGPARVVIALLLLLHYTQSARLFGSWEKLTSAEPMIDVDHALHLYHASMGSQFLLRSSRTFGDDPYFMAWAPKTPFHDPSAGLFDITLAFVGGGYHPACYKITVFVTLLSLPILFLIASTKLGMSPTSRVWMTAFLLASYWLGFTFNMIQSGLVSFVWSSGWILLTLALLERFADRQSLFNWLAMTLVGAWTLFLHPTVPVVIGTSLLVFACVQVPRKPWKFFLGLLAGLGIVLLLDGRWLLEMGLRWPIRKVQFIFLATSLSPWQWMFEYVFVRPVEACVVALGSAGTIIWFRESKGKLLRTVVPALFATFALNFFGSVWEITRNLEPLRFQIPLVLLACLPAGTLLEYLFRTGKFALFRRSLASVVLFVAFAWIVIGMSPAYLFQAIVRPREFSIGLPKEANLLINWINENTDASARILFEDQLRLLETTRAESQHWTCLLPIFTKREFIGGQYQVTPMIHHYASFGDMHLAGTAIQEINSPALLAFFRNYNVGWIVCWSKASKATFDRIPSLKFLGTLPRHTIKHDENTYFLYATTQPHSFFAVGTGEVEHIDYDLLILKNLRPENGKVVLRYHRPSYAVSTPQVTIDDTRLGFDPVPFLTIVTDKPIDRLEIRNQPTILPTRTKD